MKQPVAAAQEVAKTGGLWAQAIIWCHPGAAGQGRPHLFDRDQRSKLQGLHVGEAARPLPRVGQQYDRERQVYLPALEQCRA